MHGRQMPAMIAGVVGVAAILLAAGVPLARLLPLALLAACPLMMLVMMRGMNQGGHDLRHRDQQPSGPAGDRAPGNHRWDG